MKNFRNYTLIALTAISLAACSSDDDADIPEIINEEEVITTVTLTLQSGSETIVLRSQDLDGDGPNAPTVTVSGDLDVSTVYNGSIEFLNETESPAEDITEEVVEESDEHQVFYTPSTGLDAAVTYEDFDGNGNPLGTIVTFTTGDTAGEGTLTVTLRHEPNKPNDGSLSDAGGETDVQVTFPVTVE
ncbi:type 1 periplasmic binding fold superfamily protein [Dokdonia sp. Dokd-P16]|uniref:type 1 periplasmic binding fold superfamily protein n=1 Tax=Dokdonia sp. Dokd-P16 TaxID=2173169 RepID=UPI000D547748|nr:type 1 periplasmic binding fold superfamily protein [Dokdonia sp. Dokd-P16]AWH75724.1 type 1 periplasmic binding fold superfamily protein [Dokdonia sp. Dokd-P16]